MNSEIPAITNFTILRGCLSLECILSVYPSCRIHYCQELVMFVVTSTCDLVTFIPLFFLYSYSFRAVLLYRDSFK